MTSEIRASPCVRNRIRKSIPRDRCSSWSRAGAAGRIPPSAPRKAGWHPPYQSWWRSEAHPAECAEIGSVRGPALEFERESVPAALLDLDRCRHCRRCEPCFETVATIDAADPGGIEGAGGHDHVLLALYRILLRFDAVTDCNGQGEGGFACGKSGCERQRHRVAFDHPWHRSKVEGTVVVHLDDVAGPVEAHAAVLLFERRFHRVVVADPLRRVADPFEG